MYLRLVKSRYVFLIGFAIGFVFALLFFFVQDVKFTGCSRARSYQHSMTKNSFPMLSIAGEDEMDKEIVLQNWMQENETVKGSPDITYGKWLKYQEKARVRIINLDEHLYSPGHDGKLEVLQGMESDWLASKVHVTCIVFVKKLKLAKSIKCTWGRRCNKIYFFGQRMKDADVPVISVEVKLISSWQFLCEAMNYVWRDKDTLQWIIFVKDDTVVIPENLRYMVAPLNYTQHHYLGHPVVMWGQSYNVAHAGYVLSAGALGKIVRKFDNSEKCAAGGKYWKKEDYYLAKHLAAIGIQPSDTRDQYLRGTFHGYSLQNLLWGVIRPGSYWTHALYPTQESCCSSMSVTFSAGEADKMYTLDYLLYHLFVLRGANIFGARPAPTLVPEEDVWRVALKEEFNITYLEEISSEAYYEIWHAKYSEPEQLIAKNYKSMPDVLSSVLTAYELENKSVDKSWVK